jgi:hypothetical protein
MAEHRAGAVQERGLREKQAATRVQDVTDGPQLSTRHGAGEL